MGLLLKEQGRGPVMKDMYGPKVLNVSALVFTGKNANRTIPGPCGQWESLVEGKFALGR